MNLERLQPLTFASHNESLLMNLIVDRGNTLVKIAVFQNNQPIEIIRQKGLEKDFIKDILQRYPEIIHGIYSSVSQDFPDFLFQSPFPWLEMDHLLKFPFLNKYLTPQTLGLDRLALVSAATSKYPGKNVLIIDTGTCITYDFINQQGEYLGGAISPGFNMRIRAMHQFTANLPILDLKEPLELIGNSTRSSLLSGAVKGTQKEVDGVMKEYDKRYPKLITVITGGDAYLLNEMVKNTIFAVPDFVLIGLNYILEYNAERL